MRRSSALLCALALLPAICHAQPPAPIHPAYFAFPGSMPAPASGVSASLALADRWLGDEPFGNPAIPAHSQVSVTPVFQRVSRQDLSAANRDFSDEGGYVDLAGASAAVKIRAVALEAYFTQSELRLEDNTFTLGLGLIAGPSAEMTLGSSAREMRAGGGVSFALARARVGVAVEWTNRTDHYALKEVSGSPSAGNQTADFSGTGVGAQAGATATFHLGKHALDVGAAARMIPELTMDGTQVLDLASGFTSAPIHATRASAWEGGLSARFAWTEDFRVIAGAGARAAQDWNGFDVTSGEMTQWSLAGEYHDAEDAWTLRFGGGSERQSGAPEPNSAVFALGLGWQFTSMRVDGGLLHRSIERTGEPNSYEDRLLLTLTVR
jgi:hypothetical protein